MRCTGEKGESTLLPSLCLLEIAVLLLGLWFADYVLKLGFGFVLHSGSRVTKFKGSTILVIDWHSSM